MTRERGPEARSLTVAGQRVHFHREGHGRAVVLLHGASGNLRDWTYRAASEIARGYEVVAFDRPGLGLSTWPGRAGASLALQARLLREALRQLGIPRAILVGHSYGGSVALAWALDAPESVDGLVLVAAPSQVWPGGLGLTTNLLAAPILGPLVARGAPLLLPDAVAERAVERVFAPQAAPPGYLAHLRPDLVLAPMALRANALQLSALKPQIRAMVPRYPGLDMPVELLHGSADTTVGLDIHSRPLAAQLPRARLTVLEGIGHMAHQAALPDLLAAIDRIAAAT